MNNTKQNICVNVANKCHFTFHKLLLHHCNFHAQLLRKIQAWHGRIWASQQEDLFLSLGLWCQILKIKALAHDHTKQSCNTSKTYLNSWLKHCLFFSKKPVCRELLIHYNISVQIFLPGLAVFWIWENISRDVTSCARWKILQSSCWEDSLPFHRWYITYLKM